MMMDWPPPAVVRGNFRTYRCCRHQTNLMVRYLLDQGYVFTVAPAASGGFLVDTICDPATLKRLKDSDVGISF